MAKRIVSKAERNAERYDAKETGYRLYEESQMGKSFEHLMPYIVSDQNIILAFRNICKNKGSKTPGTDGKTIANIQSLPVETVIKTVRNKLSFYQPKKVRRVEIPKANGKTRPLGIPSIWDRLIQQCILQVLEPICEAKFHERNNGFRPYRSTQNAIAQCYKMIQLQNLHFVVDVDIVSFFDNINHDKEVLKYYVTDYVEDFENFSLEKMIEAFRQTRKYILAIVLKESGEVIGNILQCNGTNRYMNTVEVGYAIGKKYWNKGYMSEALKAMIDLLFESGVHKVNACHIPENIASGRVMEKCGMKYEGRKIDDLFYHGRYWDTLNYYIINEEV